MADHTEQHSTPPWNPEQPEAGDPWEHERVTIERGVLEFLRGRGPLLGCWFGERPPGERGKYWWRKYLDPQTTHPTHTDPGACPTCGTPAEVVSSDEGTSYYRPVDMVRVEFALGDRHGGIWTRDGGDGRWHCGGYEHDTSEELEAVAGPLRPLYAGPVEDNDG